MSRTDHGWQHFLGHSVVRSRADWPVAAEVLVPLVGPAGGSVLRVLATPDIPGLHPAHLDPRISDLLELGLYGAGQQAIAALRLCRQRRGGILSAPTLAVSVANPGDAAGLSPKNASSAELGLLLALAIGRSSATQRDVVATGRILMADGGSEPQVGAVHGLHEKFLSLLKLAQEPGAAALPKIMFCPLVDPDGTPVATRYGSEIDALSAVGASVFPVATVRAALDSLGAETLVRHRSESRLRVLAVTVGGLVAICAAVTTLVLSPVPIRFLPVASDEGLVHMSPVRVLASAVDAHRHAIGEPCQIDLQPAYLIGDGIGIRFASQTPDRITELTGLHAAILIVGAQSGVKALPLPLVAKESLLHDASGKFLANVVTPVEDNLLVILVRRIRPFDLDDLQREVSTRIAPLDPSVRLRAAANMFAHDGMGALQYRFRSTDDFKKC